MAKDKVASGTALRQTYLRDLTRSVAAAPVEQAMKVIVDVDMVGMTLDGAGFQCAVVCRARSSRKLYTNVCGLDTLAAAEDAESLAHRAVVAGGQHGPTRRKIPLFGKSNNRM